MSLASEYTQVTRKIFEMYKKMGDAVLERLSTEELHYCPSSESNSIAVLVKHMSGNMLSRFTDFLTTDGEKEWRDRDGEFEDTLVTKEEIIAAWEKGWTCLFTAFNSLTDDVVENGKAVIRQEPHSIVAAFNRQLAHYAGHVGQMVYIAKVIQNEGWKSLSIPKGASKGWRQPFLK
ncbi:MAG TPA: DUF1572 family protein [Edaphocola sp.]|nr:DUF1572 family protein [Edaphocola sp.]